MKLKNQKGQGLVEYLIIVAIIAVSSIGIMRVVGHGINTKFAKIAKALGAKVDGDIEQAEVKKSHYSKKSMRNFMTGSGSKDDSATDED
jgi:pilus assembly protein Flp/PilA